MNLIDEFNWIESWVEDWVWVEFNWAWVENWVDERILRLEWELNEKLKRN